MPEAFSVVTSYRTIRVLSDTQVLEAEYVICKTIPTGISFAYAVPYDAWLSDTGEPGAAAVDLLGIIANTIESLVAHNHVVAGSAVQDTDANDLLVDAADLVVEYDRTAQGLQPLRGTASVPMLDFFSETFNVGGVTYSSGPTPAEVVDAEYARLRTLAGA